MKTLLAVLLLTGIASADPARRAARQQERAMILEHFDVNHDGVLDRRERKMARREMRQLQRQLRKQDRMERRAMRQQQGRMEPPMGAPGADMR